MVKGHSAFLQALFHYHCDFGRKKKQVTYPPSKYRRVVLATSADVFNTHKSCVGARQ